MAICLERGADLHTAQLMPLPLTVSCFCKIQIGFTFLVLVYPGSPGQRAVKRAHAVLSPCTADYLCYLKSKVTAIVNLPTKTSLISEKCHRTTLWNAGLIYLIRGTSILFSSKWWWSWKKLVVLFGSGGFEMSRFCCVVTEMSMKQHHLQRGCS